MKLRLTTDDGYLIDEWEFPEDYDLAYPSEGPLLIEEIKRAVKRAEDSTG